MKSVGVRYLRTSCGRIRNRTSERYEVSEISDTKHSDCGYKALSMWYYVYYIHTETFVIFASLFISNLSKMLKFAATHRETTAKSKYQPKTFVDKYL